MCIRDSVLADWFHMEQKSWKNRLILCVPVLGVGAILGIGKMCIRDSSFTAR